MLGFSKEIDWYHHHHQFLFKIWRKQWKWHGCTSFLGCFLFQPTAEPNQPNSWYRRCCHSTPYVFSYINKVNLLQSYYICLTFCWKYRLFWICPNCSLQKSLILCNFTKYYLYGCRLLPFPLNFYRPLVPKQSMCTTAMYWTSIQNVIVHEHHTAYSKQ